MLALRLVAAVLIALPMALLSAPLALAATYGGELEGFEYPYEVKRYEFTSQGTAMQMAYMEVAAAKPNGRTVVLLHGKNFCGATWGATIKVLSEAGYRVVALDQVGFCKSTKPARYQFSFAQLASNTHALLASIGVERPVVVGHSMGGMLAARYALMCPKDVAQLVMVDPLGLEDWQAAGVPYQTIDAAYENELKTSAGTIKAYQLKFYYDGVWKAEYQPWVDMLAGMYAGPDGRLVAWNQAQTSDMVFTQPVVHEFGRIAVPTVLIVGGKDRTAPGANRAAPEIAEKLGRYDLLGPAAAKAIPGAKLIAFPELGHAPQMEAPDRFHEALLKALAPA